jgi:hypothetical protein
MNWPVLIISFAAGLIGRRIHDDNGGNLVDIICFICLVVGIIILIIEETK